MADKIRPRGLDADGYADGRYAVTVVGGKATHWTLLPTNIVVLVRAGTYISVDNTDPTQPIVTAMVPLTTLNSSGLPEIVFDSDGHIVYTEAP